MRRTRAERAVLDVLTTGGIAWRSSLSRRAWLVPPGDVPGRRVQLSTLERLEEAGLITSSQAWHGVRNETPGDVTWTLRPQLKDTHT